MVLAGFARPDATGAGRDGESEMNMKRTAEREEFLSDVLVGAIEHAGYGFPDVEEWHYDENEPGEAYAVITDRWDDESEEEYRVTIDTIAAGLGVIRQAELRTDPKYPTDGPVLHNAKTGQRLYLNPESRKAILECDRENDAGEIDVAYALAILECALFGAVTYG